MGAQNSRAKILVNAFEKQIEVANKALDQNFFKTAEGKIGSLERSLESIKQKDPDFDTSNLEKQLADLKNRCGANKEETLTTRANEQEQYYNNIKVNEKLDVITRTKSLSEEEASELLALDISTIDMSRYQRVVEEFSEMTLSRDLPNIKSLMDETPIVQEVLIHYNRFSNQKRYWQTVSKLIPNSDVIKSTYTQFETVDKELGGEAGVKAKAKAQYGEYLKNKTMPKAVSTDATAIAIIKNTYEEEGRKQGYNRTLIKINLLENDWTILTKKYSGVIVGRKRAAAIAFKDNNTGECSMYRFFEVYQQYNGSGYSGEEGTSTTQELIHCENIK
jgi:hypothetical protein